MKNPNCSISKWILLFSISCFLFSCQNEVNEKDPSKEEWIELFDGSNWKSWTPKYSGYKLGNNYKNRFVLKDSLLSVRYEPSDTFKGDFGHLFYKEKFSHYRLQATYRFVGEQMPNAPTWAFRNNGLMLHCQSPESMGLDQDFPISLEMQLLGGNGQEERSNGNLCTPGTNVVMGDSLFTPHCVGSTSRTFHGDQWVTVEALVLGDSLIEHLVEEKVVLSYSRPTFGNGAVDGFDKTLYEEGAVIKEGYISIQAETHPIDFKSISLLNLCGCMDEKAKNFKSYFIKADNVLCQY